MKNVGVFGVALILCAAAGPSLAQAAPASASAGSRPIARAVFLANMDSEFGKMDADKNGQVTKDEIESFERAVSVVKAQAKNRQLFNRLDANHDGQLSAAEFSQLASPASPNAAPILSHMDLNRDQSITLVEYRTATLSNFDRMDADKNGIVTPAEMKAAGIGR